MAMELYDMCVICEKWDDLAKWHDLDNAYVCTECFNKLNKFVPGGRGKGLTYSKIFTTVSEEIRKSLRK